MGDPGDQTFVLLPTFTIRKGSLPCERLSKESPPVPSVRFPSSSFFSFLRVSCLGPRFFLLFDPSMGVSRNSPGFILLSE